MVLKIKEMVFPRQVIVGHGAFEHIPELCNRIVDGNALVVADKNTKKILADKIINLLKDNNYNVSSMLISASTLKEVTRVQNAIERKSAGFVLGVGGGTVIDVAKFASYKTSRDFISVPTAASHDGIASPQASLKESKGSISKRAISPLAIVADTSIIKKAPYRMLASGCADVISNLSAINDWELAHRLKNEEFSTYAASLSKTAAELLLKNAGLIKTKSEDAVWIAVKGMIVSGVAMSVAGSSRPASGAEHMFSHVLDKISPGRAMHGEQCGVGAIMMMYLHGENWEEIRDALKKIGAPTTAKELDIPKKKIIQALVNAHSIRPERYTILGEGGLTKDAAKAVAKKTGVI
jgi:glycerol-1-phosphate dehydrogenase [NAD(P)+]